MVMRCRWSARGLTAPGYHHGARGRDYCGVRNPHKVSRTPTTFSTPTFSAQNARCKHTRLKGDGVARYTGSDVLPHPGHARAF